MKCPFCKKDNDKVVDTRVHEDGCLIKRRRFCNSCKKRFTTYERIEVTSVRVKKRDGSRVPFDRAKLRQGIERACWKRSVSDAQISELVAQVENRIDTDGETEIDTNYIGEAVMDLLRDLDEVAYVRFASVYREFRDAKDFARELNSLFENNARKRNGAADADRNGEGEDGKDIW